MDTFSISSILNWTAGILITALVGKLLLVLTKNTHYAKMVNAVPGCYAVPIIGHVWECWVPQEDVFTAFVKLVNKSAKETVSHYWLGPFEARFVLHTAKGAEVILNSTTHITKSDEYSYLHSWLGLGLLTSTGNKWLTHRKILTPSFHFQILDDFINVFNEQSQVLIGLLKKKVGQGPFNIFPYITHCTLDIIHMWMGAIIVLRVIRPWLSNRFLFNFFPEKRQETYYTNILHSNSRKVIKERRKLLQNNKHNINTDTQDIFGKKIRLAFLDALLNAKLDGKSLSDEEIREEVDTFMFEGHDTTSAAISWALYLLGHNPKIQSRLQNELDSVLGNSSQTIGATEISQMKYMEAVIKEALRLYPSVPLYGRKIQEDVNVEGHIIPAHSNVVIGAYFIHRDPEVFPDPEKFKPERFLDNDTKRNPFAYIPFSAGPRNCIGQKFAMMEEKVVLADILRNFTIISHDKREGLKMVTEPILRPAFGLSVSLEMRMKKNCQ